MRGVGGKEEAVLRGLGNGVIGDDMIPFESGSCCVYQIVIHFQHGYLYLLLCRCSFILQSLLRSLIIHIHKPRACSDH